MTVSCSAYANMKSSLQFFDLPPPPVFSHVTITVMSPSDVAAPHPTWILPHHIQHGFCPHETWWCENTGGTALAHPMDAHQAGQQGPLASDLTIYGHSVEQRESSPHTMHNMNMKNHVFFWVSLLSLPFFKYLYPEAGLLSQLVQGQLIKREKSSVRLSSCTAKSSVYCFNITNDKLGATDLHCLHNDWIFTTNFIRWVMTDRTL